MSTYDNADPMPDIWQCEPRPSPFDIAETPQHGLWLRGVDVALAEAEVDSLGTE